MVKAQEWLEQKYANWRVLIKLEDSDDAEKNTIEGGSLVIKDYPHLKYLIIDGAWLKSPLDKLNIINCPELSRIKCFNHNIDWPWFK